MSLYKIPVPSDVVWSEQTTAIGGVPYRMEFQYNNRDAIWYWSIYDQAKSPILLSVPLRTNRDLAGQYPQLPLPAGLFFVIDNTGQNTDPSLASFASTHVFYYEDFA